MTGMRKHMTGRWRSRLRGREAAEERHALVLRKLAHDLRNPLNSILLNAQLLEELCPGADALRIAQRIQKQALETNAILEKAVERNLR